MMATNEMAVMSVLLGIESQNGGSLSLGHAQRVSSLRRRQDVYRRLHKYVADPAENLSSFMYGICLFLLVEKSLGNADAFKA
jgi:hypothetical protein